MSSIHQLHTSRCKNHHRVKLAFFIRKPALAIPVAIKTLAEAWSSEHAKVQRKDCFLCISGTNRPSSKPDEKPTTP